MKERQHLRQLENERVRAELAESEALQAQAEKEAVNLVVEKLQESAASERVKNDTEKADLKRRMLDLEEKHAVVTSPRLDPEAAAGRRRQDLLEVAKSKAEAEAKSLAGDVSRLEKQVEQLTEKAKTYGLMRSGWR